MRAAFGDCSLKNRKIINVFILLPALAASVACARNQVQHARGPIVAVTAQSSCPVVRASIKRAIDPGIMAPGRDIGLHLPKVPTILDVLVDASGKPKTIRLIQSSGDAYIDKFAMRLAKATEYLPASRDCKYHAEHFRFVEDWKQIQRELEQ